MTSACGPPSCGSMASTSRRSGLRSSKSVNAGVRTRPSEVGTAGGISIAQSATAFSQRLPSLTAGSTTIFLLLTAKQHKLRGLGKPRKTLRIGLTLSAIPCVVMAGESSDESNLGGVAAIAGCSHGHWGLRGVKPSTTYAKRALAGGSARAGLHGAPRCAKHAAGVVAADEPVRPSGLAALL